MVAAALDRNMTVYENDLPGVGKKFELDLGGGTRLITVVHHDGKREVYFQPEADADGDKLFELTDRQARTFGSILDGSHFQPIALDQVEVPLGEAFIEWVEVDDDSPLVEASLAEAGIRQATGVSIIAIQRGDQTIANPEPTEVVQAGDILVSLGTRTEQSSFEELVDEDA
jgi:TrkA domain protein